MAGRQRGGRCVIGFPLAARRCDGSKETYYVDEKLYSESITIILKDGTSINLPVDINNVFDRTSDHQSGKTTAKTQHWLDGSFESDDVLELIIFGIRFVVE